MYAKVPPGPEAPDRRAQPAAAHHLSHGWALATALLSCSGMRPSWSFAAACVIGAACAIGCDTGGAAGPGAGAGGASGSGGAGGGGGGGGASGAGGLTGRCDPTRVTLRRLNRAEYDNTVQALLGTSATPAREFPADDAGGGYDNNADSLSLSPLLVEKYQLAAQTLIEGALRAPRQGATAQRFEAEQLRSTVGATYNDTAWNLWSNGALSAPFSASSGVQFRLSARAFGQQAGPDPARMRLSLDGREVQTFDVTATQGAPRVYSATAAVAAGAHTFTVEFINDFYEPANMLDRNLIVDWLEVEGMYPAPPDPASRARILTCDPMVVGAMPCARQVIAAFGRRAWRRPLADAEVSRLTRFVELAAQEGDDFDAGISLALQAILLSPRFLYRVELDPDPTSPAPHALDDFELAARLSYFLWSSSPDEALDAAADAGRLGDPAEVERQARRMLEDERARAITENFAGQWLYTRALDYVSPDYMRFPEWDPVLRDSMRAETRQFFATLLADGGTLRDLLTAPFSFVNDRLARHYGLPAVQGSALVRVDLSATPRRGILGQGSVLATTAYPTRTSIVKRGKFVLSQLLCREPDDPPPNIPRLPEMVDPNASLRDRMMAHRANPECAVCHAQMDPLGFGLEHFDGTGKWRDLDGRFPIDATGELSGMRRFDGAAQMAAVIAEDPDLPGCVARHALTYALGRRADACSTQEFLAAWKRGNYALKELFVLVATSSAFRMRAGEVTR